ncbi:hypothetical protein IE53DRAFT_371602 [Violaceomyces palustris]|uniref:Uncharacterized protein n=1 Tax=Violaceomyces palustris TaxID=1673888 RepID=A0ACD0NNA9_9BASI|nr:hypothetical protein IE53DRAFT_371602 [Violaceomyces palustris]
MPEFWPLTLKLYNLTVSLVMMCGGGLNFLQKPLEYSRLVIGSLSACLSLLLMLLEFIPRAGNFSARCFSTLNSHTGRGLLSIIVAALQLHITWKKPSYLVMTTPPNTGVTFSRVDATLVHENSTTTQVDIYPDHHTESERLYLYVSCATLAVLGILQILVGSLTPLPLAKSMRETVKVLNADDTRRIEEAASVRGKARYRPVSTMNPRPSFSVVMPPYQSYQAKTRYTPVEETSMYRLSHRGSSGDWKSYTPPQPESDPLGPSSVPGGAWYGGGHLATLSNSSSGPQRRSSYSENLTSSGWESVQLCGVPNDGAGDLGCLAAEFGPLQSVSGSTPVQNRPADKPLPSQENKDKAPDHSGIRTMTLGRNERGGSNDAFKKRAPASLGARGKLPSSLPAPLSAIFAGRSRPSTGNTASRSRPGTGNSTQSHSSTLRPPPGKMYGTMNSRPGTANSSKSARSLYVPGVGELELSSDSESEVSADSNDEAEVLERHARGGKLDQNREGSSCCGGTVDSGSKEWVSSQVDLTRFQGEGLQTKEAGGEALREMEAKRRQRLERKMSKREEKKARALVRALSKKYDQDGLHLNRRIDSFRPNALQGGSEGKETPPDASNRAAAATLTEPLQVTALSSTASPSSPVVGDPTLVGRAHEEYARRYSQSSLLGSSRNRPRSGGVAGDHELPPRASTQRWFGNDPAKAAVAGGHRSFDSRPAAESGGGGVGEANRARRRLSLLMEGEEEKGRGARRSELSPTTLSVIESNRTSLADSTASSFGNGTFGHQEVASSNDLRVARGS